MKKEASFLLLFIIVISLVSSEPLNFYDDFEQYSLGKLNTSNWISQYSSRVNVIDYDSKNLEINSLTEFQGDRDVHIELNNSNYPTQLFDNLIISWDFQVLECNSIWKVSQGVTPQGSSLYSYYSNDNNFISIEFKINANNLSCGSGTAQISAFKRENGITSPIIPYTTYSFIMNKTFNPVIQINKNNSNITNVLINLNNISIISSAFNYSTYGKILFESGGTKTIFDNINITASDFICIPEWKEIIEPCYRKKQLHWYLDINNCNTDKGKPSNITTFCFKNKTRII